MMRRKRAVVVSCSAGEDIRNLSSVGLAGLTCLATESFSSLVLARQGSASRGAGVDFFFL
jgi:hypothetical protein